MTQAELWIRFLKLSTDHIAGTDATKQVLPVLRRLQADYPHRIATLVDKTSKATVGVRRIFGDNSYADLYNRDLQNGSLQVTHGMLTSSATIH